MPLGRKITVVVSDRRVWQHLQLSLKFGFAIFCEMDGQKPNKGVKMLSPVEKARILSWREEGVSVDVIAERLGRHQSAIFRLLNKAKNLPPLQSPERKKGSGRPKKIPGHALKILERFVKKNPLATAGDIKQQVPEVSSISVRHINWLILKKLKMPSRIAAQKPLLTKKMKEKAGFCQETL